MRVTSLQLHLLESRLKVKARAASRNHSPTLTLNHQHTFTLDEYDDRSLHTTNTLTLYNWQPWVIIACTTGKLHKQEKTEQSIVKNIIAYHGVCLLSDKACVDSLRAASTLCSYYTATDTLLLTGKTESILKPFLTGERVC